jgi:hypothetical protein
MSVRADDEAERVTVAWRVLTAWLAEHAPLSYASILPPATGEEIATADARLRQDLGFGLPVELGALWRLCGGVEHRYIEENEEGGDVGSGAFLPGGVMFSPAEALDLRLAMLGWGRPGDVWNGAEVLPWLTRDEAGPEYGRYAGTTGVGEWALVDPLEEPAYPSIAAYLESTLRTLTEGPANLMGDDMPGLVHGCLIWDNPENPALHYAAQLWTPIH